MNLHAIIAGIRRQSLKEDGRSFMLRVVTAQFTTTFDFLETGSDFLVLEDPKVEPDCRRIYVAFASVIAIQPLWL